MRDMPATSVVASGTLVSVSGFWGCREGESFSCLSGPNEAPIVALRTCEQSLLMEKPTFFCRVLDRQPWNLEWNAPWRKPNAHFSLNQNKPGVFSKVVHSEHENICLFI